MVSLEAAEHLINHYLLVNLLISLLENLSFPSLINKYH